MNILFDINHPAHVHLFRNAIGILKSRGHHITITARQKDLTIQLLKNYNFIFHVLSKARKGLGGLGIELITRQLKLIPILLKNKIQVCVSVTGACSVHICRLFGIPCLVFYDTEHATLQNSLTIPFATKFITPDCYLAKVGRNHLTYAGTHDLAYLHPNYFKPDKSIYHCLKIKVGDPFVILRFVAWQAAHDRGQQGLSLEFKKEIISTVEKFGKVFITSEAEVDESLAKYRIPIPPEKIFEALYYASMYIGEGGSMATEAATLGTPAIFISTLSAGVLQELEKKYGLLYSFLPNQEKTILKKICKLLSQNNLKWIWLEKRDKFLSEKIDVTQWMIEQILAYDN